ncbi:MAG: type I methionyl aminopeptidase [Candidatus Omnitrophica bacterium]|nr:type I methionyl aminopeptidase [Candidatus Omnitrophota bacterium]
MTILTDETEIRKIRGSGRIIKEIFDWLKDNIREGISTAALDREIETIIRQKGGEPAFKGYRGYPASSCVSVNEVVVHGIPSDRIILKDGDIVSIDIGVRKNDYFTDAARTFALGGVSEEARKLIRVTEKSLCEGMSKAVVGNSISDISGAIERTIRKSGYQEVRTFVGHGTGRELHESPEIPNWREKGRGSTRLKKGLVLAIEPMVNIGTREVRILADGWTAVTKDGKLSAHFEHTVIVGKGKAEALT